jgi:hypothetical protein
MISKNGKERLPISSTSKSLIKYNFISIFREYKSEKLKTMALTVTLARDEILRTGLTLFPFLSVGFLIMSLFSILTVGLSAFYYGQVSLEKNIYSDDYF